jgi:dodecin
LITSNTVSFAFASTVADPLGADRSGGESMSNDHVYRMIELAGSSESSIEDAIQNAISRASKTLHGLRWFEVVETRGHIDNGRVAHYQVVIKVGFTIDD